VTSGDSCNEKYAEFLLPVYMANVEVILMVNVSKEGQVFKCEICGNVVVVKENGGGELVCCGEPMQLESA
jgi:desulfoferrodoxin-like iron-binding protein